MCATCGCHEQHEHHHDHADHDHAPDGHRRIRLEHDVLARNDALAAVNRRRLAAALY